MDVIFTARAFRRDSYLTKTDIYQYALFFTIETQCVLFLLYAFKVFTFVMLSNFRIDSDVENVPSSNKIVDSDVGIILEIGRISMKGPE